MKPHIVGGAVCGLAWAAGLRGFMAQVATRQGSEVTWLGTFVWVLAPGVLVGGLLGFALYLWRHGGAPRGRWLVLSPFLFGAVLLPPIVTLDFDGFFGGGIGAGTIAIPAFAICGGYAIAGRRTWLRILASLPPLSAIPVWALTASHIGGAELALDTSRGLWVALYFWSHLAVFALACSIPFRIGTLWPGAGREQPARPGARMTSRDGAMATSTSPRTELPTRASGEC